MAFSCHRRNMNVDWSLLFSAVALAIIFEAMAYILMPAKMQRMLAEISRSKPEALRRYGLLALGIGLLLLFIARA